MFSQLLTKNSQLKTIFRGFTIVELVVTVGIFLAITSVVVANYPKLNGKLSIDLLAHDIAISTRQAQSFALSVRTPSSLGFQLKTAYGMHFEKDNKSFLFFADVPDGVGNVDHKYIPASGDRIEQTYGINGSYDVTKICVQTSGAPDCTGTTLDITFRRPHPEAMIYGTRNSTGENEAWFCIGSESYSQQIHIWKTGQIGILSDPC